MLNRRRKTASSKYDYNQLEPRQLLAMVSFVDGHLKITGGIGDNDLSLKSTAIDGPVELFEDDAVAQQFNADDIEAISFYGGAGNDTFRLFGNVEISDGEFGTESLFPNLTSVRFFGGVGDDGLVLRFSDYSNISMLGIGGDGIDTMLAYSADSSESGSGNTSTSLRFFGNGGNDDLRALGVLVPGESVNVRMVGGEGNDKIVGSRGVDALFGSNGNDDLFGGQGNDRLIGGDGDDQLDGNVGDDILIDGLGDDVLGGGAGDDWVFGGGGADSISGGSGNDQLLGGEGDDTIYGYGGEDRLVGGLGNDRLYGGNQNDRILGNAGDDLMSGQNGDDLLIGASGHDRAVGGEGADRIFGGLGNDRLEGNDGDDVIFGNAGIDKLFGFAGADYLNGGVDNDTLNFGIDTDIDRAIGGAGSDFFVDFSTTDRLLDFVSDDDRESPLVNLDHGIKYLANRETFDVLARRENFPGAINAQEVKFLVTGVNTDSPEVHFINSNNHELHFEYWETVLGNEGGNSRFNQETYFAAAARVNVAGSLVAHDDYQANDGQYGLFSIELWPTDPIGFSHVEAAYQLITEKASWLATKVAVHASSETLKGVIASQQALYDNSDVRIIETDDLYGNVDFQAMNQAASFGRLVLADGATTLSGQDIPIFSSLPNDLTTVAGTITEVPQTPLSHVNLKARQNGIPNAYVKNASTNPQLLPFLDQLVRLSVGPDGFEVRAATQAEVDAHFESIRPTETQTPARDLTVIDVKPLDQIGFADASVYGTKAANVAELHSLMPAIAPDGYAIPISFYHRYMIYNGFYDDAQAMMDDPQFQSDPVEREAMLKAFRNQIKIDGVMPAWMEQELTELQAAFPVDATPRLRSSANAEDLVGFNGAGLYSSYTHHADEGHISKSVKQVWASLWNYRAYEEREFYRVDHLKSAMGVLVHPNYSDELANGVAVTKNIFDPNWEGNYFNVQVGEDLVTNPDAASIPEEFLVAKLSGFQEYETQYIRSSNQLAVGERILTSSQITNLVSQMDRIKAHFAPLYGTTAADPDFAMEIEFKITASGHLAIKQVRPWVG